MLYWPQYSPPRFPRPPGWHSEWRHRPVDGTESWTAWVQDRDGLQHQHGAQIHCSHQVILHWKRFILLWYVRNKDWKFIWGYPEGMKSQVQRKQTKSIFAQSMFQAKKSNLLFLFNLKTDPNETSNLVGKYPKVLKIMMKKVRKIMTSGEVQAPDVPNLTSKSLPTFWNGTVSPGWCWVGETEENGIGVWLLRTKGPSMSLKF